MAEELGHLTSVNNSLENLPCPSDFISKPWQSAGSSIPLDVLQLDHSFGYNCKKFFNLCLIDARTLVFGSGNFIHFLDIKSREVKVRRSACGGGIGCITKNPKTEWNYLTVAENGDKPLVLIYKYPEMEAVTVLRGGAKHSYSHMNYSMDGELLATQAGEPDYMITIWDWRKSTTVLRVQSFQNDVVCVRFSSYDSRQLATCGLGHVKFWKMSKTFTGLKLIGELGRFGKIEICDIYAVFPMADEKVISGCEWGNLLVWEEGLIRFEVCRKNRQPCHDAPITQITMVNEYEVMTVGMDGYVRKWFWETVELADPSEEDRFVEIDPVYELRVGDHKIPSQLMCLVEEDPDDEMNHHWFAQDGKGGIWYCNLNPTTVPDVSKQIYRCHDGGIQAVAASSCSTHVATLDEGGRLHIYDYVRKILICWKIFPAGGKDLIWIPKTIDPSGMVLICGFDDGVIRMVVVYFNKSQIVLLNATKPHTKSITKLSINPNESCLVSGSEDRTVFIHSLQKTSPFITLLPVGFVELESFPTAFTWHTNRFATLIVGSHCGQLFQFDVPERPRDYTETSFRLKHIRIKTFQFKSVKSEIRKNTMMEKIKIKKEARRLQKIEQMKQLRDANPSMEINEETFLADSDPDEEESEPLYVPKVPNGILWLHFTEEDTIWMSMSGYDAGFIYEYSFSGWKPEGVTRNTSIPDLEDMEIHSFLVVNNFLAFGTRDGKIRINRFKENFRDLTDYLVLAMHDNLNGAVTGLCCSFDEQFLFSVGLDGNLFSYKWNNAIGIERASEIQQPSWVKEANDITERNFLSLEEQKIKIQEDTRAQLEAERKEKFLNIISEYRVHFKEIMKRNRALPKRQQYAPDDFELDKRITDDLIKSLDHELQLVRRKIAFDLEKSRVAKEKVLDFFIEPLDHLQFEVSALRMQIRVKSFRVKRLDDDFYQQKEEVLEQIERKKQRKSCDRRKSIRNGCMIMLDDEETKVEEVRQAPNSFLQTLSLEKESKLDLKVKRLLEKYRERKQRETARKLEWEAVYAEKPDSSKNHEDDDRKMEEAKKAIGDYKLKSDPEYKPTEDQSTLQKYYELLSAREELNTIRTEYNKKVLELRTKKVTFYDYLNSQHAILDEIHKKIPKELQRTIPALQPINESKEFPEKILKANFKAGGRVDTKNFILKRSEEVLLSFLNAETVHEDRYNRLNCEVLGLTENAKKLTFGMLCNIIEDNPKLSEKNKEKLEEVLSKKKESPWQTETRYLRMIDNLFVQDRILLDIEERIEELDKEIQTLAESKLQIETDAKFLEVYILTLNQELELLKEFEKMEERYISNVDSSSLEKITIQNEITRRKSSIEARRKVIEGYNQKQKLIQQQFLTNTKGMKFNEFLLKVFKKKYKPQRSEADADMPDESSSSDTDSSQDGGDDASMNTMQMSDLQFDDSFCPPGLDPKIFDLTLGLRSQRHALQQNVHQEQRAVDEEKRKIDELIAQLKIVGDKLQETTKQLADFRYGKQKILNKVETLIVLRMDQLQYLKPGKKLRSIVKTLLFETENVNRLQTRVGQLGTETLDARRRHKVNIIHLSRMKQDCEYMEKKVQKLKAEINNAMIKKFGMVVNLDELEESVLRHFMLNLKTDLTEEKKMAAKSIQERRDALASLESELIRETQIGTEKLNVLTVLQEEKNYLHEILNYQRKLVQRCSATRRTDYRHDLKKLKDIEKQQQEQIEFLEREIRALRLKSKPFLPVIRHEFTSGAIREILPPHDERDYEESVYTNAMEYSPRAGQIPDVDLFEKVNSLVKKFLLKHIGKNADENTIRKYATKVAKYLSYVSNNIDPNDSDEEDISSCVLENFQNLLPHKFLVHIANEDILKLFEQIVGVFHYEEANVNINEVLTGIVNNSLELAEKLNSMNYTQDAVTEMFKQMIEVLPVEDIDNIKTIDFLTTSLADVPLINVKCVNAPKLTDDILLVAKENLIEDITLTLMNNFMEKFMPMLSRKMGFDDENNTKIPVFLKQKEET